MAWFAFQVPPSPFTLYIGRHAGHLAGRKQEDDDEEEESTDVKLQFSRLPLSLLPGERGDKGLMAVVVPKMC